jgi:hypothetical protein
MLDQLRLEKFEADADGTEFIPLEKLCVLIGRDIRRGCVVSVPVRSMIG